MNKKIIFFAIGILLIACSPNTKNIDLFNDTTCEAPCVLGITPGVTSEKEAKKILRENDSKFTCEEQELWLPSETVYWTRCDNPNVTFNVYFREDVVSSIGFSQLNLEIKQIIEKYGAPDAINVRNNSPDTPTNSYMFLRYDDIRLEIALIEINELAYKVEPTSLVAWMKFHNEQGYRFPLMSQKGSWHGYGVYQPSQE